jgi:hypothetical protein
MACNEGPADETTEAPAVETTVEETAAPVPSGLLLVTQGTTDYVIVRPEQCQNYITDAMTDLRKAIESKYGVSIKPQDDWVKGHPKGEAYISEAPEILIGETNRKESMDVLASLQPGEYKVCVSGNKLVLIGTTDYLTGLAVQEFVKFVSANENATDLMVLNEYSVLKTQDDFNKLLMGITMYAMGDSYFGGSSLGKEVTWVNKLGNKYNMTYVNYGIGGSTMSDFVTNKDPMVKRITRMKKGDANVIFLEGGRNDRSQQVPLGDRDSRDTKTFYGAVNYMLDYFREKYPNALIILVTAWKHSGKTTSGYNNITYADVMKDIAEYRNDPHIVCFYAADPEISGVDMDDVKFRTKYCIKPDDVSHLNDEGMNYVLPIIEKYVAEEYTKYLNYLNPPATTEEETTAAPEPTAEATTASHETTAAPETEPVTEPTAESGCGGFVSLTSITVLICGACLVICKKRK